MAIDDPKKKKKKRKKKESLEHKRSRILVALGIFAVVYALDEFGRIRYPGRHLRQLYAVPRTVFDCRLRRAAKGIQ